MIRTSPATSISAYLLTVGLLVMILAGCDDRISKNGSTETELKDTLTYVGREACKGCHEKQFRLFIGSDHDMAMDYADSLTVLGDFNNATFTHHGINSRFYKKEDNFYVFTEGPDGEMEEFKVEYVFGIRPLQQYLVAFPGGRYQCLPLCWDTRPEKEGGQRWFHIYGEEKIPHADVLYWTRVMQNWNYMCAECHSTNLKKNFNAATDSYHTAWSEIDVSCEACHGPGSDHINWAEEAARHPASQEPGDMGLVIHFKDPEGGTWMFKPGSKVAERTVKRDGRKTLETCARCHARRSTISEEYIFGHSFFDTHRPSLLVDPLYFPDGQIHDEVYVYASFLQSKMYHRGVICSDCHEPHSLKVYVQGNALCYRCHLPEAYGTKSHHFHNVNSSGSLCVECHMPERTYMQVDPRRDHSLRNPRPDLSGRLGTPNACTTCHQNLSTPPDWSDQMAADYFLKWYGVEKWEVHYGETFWKARRDYPEALQELIALATDSSLPAMIRSSAYYYLSGYQDPLLFEVVQQGLKDSDPLVRFGAMEGSANLDDAQKAILFRKLIHDSVRLIRTQAARNMPLEVANQLIGKEKRGYETVLAEYMESEMLNADHPFTWMNLGNYSLEKEDFAEGERDYRKAIEIEPYLPMSYLNLADLFRRRQMDSRGEEVLREGLLKNPGSASLYHSLGLLMVRQGKREDGLKQLKQACDLDPSNARFAYVYGVGLFSAGDQQEAVRFLENARNRNPFDRDILFALVSYYGEMGQLDQALSIAQELVGYYPTDASYQEVLQRLKALH